jgi:hypothetical protein
LPDPIKPTAIFELAWVPRTASGRTIVKAVAAVAAALPLRKKSLRETAGSCVSMRSSQREL